jgi:hypothetical protein
MKMYLYPLALGALVLSVMTAVKADSAIEKPWSVRVGAAWPTQDQAKTDSGTTNTAAGIEYGLTQTTGQNPTTSSVYFDYLGGTKNGGHLNTYGIGISERDYVSPTTAGSTAPTFYYGAGVGAYYVDVQNTGTLTSNGTKTSLGAKLLLGVEFQKSYFGEVSYNWLPKTNGADPSGLSVQVGVHF